MQLRDKTHLRKGGERDGEMATLWHWGHWHCCDWQGGGKLQLVPLLGPLATCLLVGTFIADFKRGINQESTASRKRHGVQEQQQAPD